MSREETMDLDEAAVAAMLAMQGYTVPVEDLREISLRLNELIRQASSWDEHAPFDDEPWPGRPTCDRDG